MQTSLIDALPELAKDFAVLHLSMQSRLNDAVPEIANEHSLRKTSPIASRM